MTQRTAAWIAALGLIWASSTQANTAPVLEELGYPEGAVSTEIEISQEEALSEQQVQELAALLLKTLGSLPDGGSLSNLLPGVELPEAGALSKVQKLVGSALGGIPGIGGILPDEIDPSDLAAILETQSTTAQGVAYNACTSIPVTIGVRTPVGVDIDGDQIIDYQASLMAGSLGNDPASFRFEEDSAAVIANSPGTLPKGLSARLLIRLNEAANLWLSFGFDSRNNGQGSLTRFETVLHAPNLLIPGGSEEVDLELISKAELKDALGLTVTGTRNPPIKILGSIEVAPHDASSCTVATATHKPLDMAIDVDRIPGSLRVTNVASTDQRQSNDPRFSGYINEAESIFAMTVSQAPTTRTSFDVDLTIDSNTSSVPVADRRTIKLQANLGLPSGETKITSQKAELFGNWGGWNTGNGSIGTRSIYDLRAPAEIDISAQIDIWGRYRDPNGQLVADPHGLALPNGIEAVESDSLANNTSKFDQSLISLPAAPASLTPAFVRDHTRIQFSADPLRPPLKLTAQQSDAWGSYSRLHVHQAQGAIGGEVRQLVYPDLDVMSVAVQSIQNDLILESPTLDNSKQYPEVGEFGWTRSLMLSAPVTQPDLHYFNVRGALTVDDTYWPFANAEGVEVVTGANGLLGALIRLDRFNSANTYAPQAPFSNKGLRASLDLGASIPIRAVMRNFASINTLSTGHRISGPSGSRNYHPNTLVELNSASFPANFTVSTADRYAMAGDNDPVYSPWQRVHWRNTIDWSASSEFRFDARLVAYDGSEAITPSRTNADRIEINGALGASNSVPQTGWICLPTEGLEDACLFENPDSEWLGRSVQRGKRGLNPEFGIGWQFPSTLSLDAEFRRIEGGNELLHADANFSSLASFDLAIALNDKLQGWSDVSTRYQQNGSDVTQTMKGSIEATYRKPDGFLRTFRGTLNFDNYAAYWYIADWHWYKSTFEIQYTEVKVWYFNPFKWRWEYTIVKVPTGVTIEILKDEVNSWRPPGKPYSCGNTYFRIGVGFFNIGVAKDSMFCN